jgi:hypothetical protein
MLEPAPGEIAAAEETSFRPRRNLASLNVRAIFGGARSDGGTLLKQYVKVLGLACTLALLLPALLIITVLSLMVARLLGVPWIAASSSTFHRR